MHSAGTLLCVWEVSVSFVVCTVSVESDHNTTWAFMANGG